MSLPAAYQRFYRTHLRFALIMILVSLLAGLSFQESASKVHLSAAVPAGVHLEFILSLALVHGHIFLVGVVVPLAFAWMLHLEANLGLEPLSGATLDWTSRLYLPGAVLTVLLLLLKGYWFVLGVRHGRTDYAQLNAAFLGSNHALRVGIYGFAHTVMALGMGILAWGLWRALRSR